jgi:hypothetical protein
LLAQTAKHVEEYGGQSDALVPLLDIVCKCQTDTKDTNSNGYDQPQAVAERCDIAIPCHVGVVGETYKDVGAGRRITVYVSKF